MKSLTFTEIETIASNLNSLALDDELKTSSIALTTKGKLWGISGGQCRVYKITTRDGKIKALRFWQYVLNDIEKRSEIISKFVQNNKSPYLLNFEFIPDAVKYKNEVYPVILMDWCPALSLKSYIQYHLTDKTCLQILQRNFLQLVLNMHSQGISHGDLHHDNIRVYDDGQLVLIDYDSVFVPDLEGFADDCLGYAGYQLPVVRELNQELSSKADYFSELIIYLSIEALIEEPALWDELNVENQEQSFLLTPNDLKNLTQSSTFIRLQSVGGKMPHLLKILCSYLQKKHINDLLPFYEVDKELGIFSLLYDYSVYCMCCGTKYYSQKDLYCVKCGCKKYI